MHYLGHVELSGGKGDMKGVLHTDPESGTKLLSFVWSDRDRRYFISSASSMSPGTPILRERWRQVDSTPNAAPVKVTITHAQPKAAEIYYSCCGKIDQHNRNRQAELKIETKLKTQKWDRRVNLSLFATMVVDSYHLMTGISPGRFCQRFYYEKLAEQLIDNVFERRALRKRQDREEASDHGRIRKGPKIAVPSSQQLTAPTPTKKMKKAKPTHREQGRCMFCSKPTSAVCRECQLAFPRANDTQYWICDKPGKVCLGYHILDKHPDKILKE